MKFFDKKDTPGTQPETTTTPPPPPPPVQQPQPSKPAPVVETRPSAPVPQRSSSVTVIGASLTIKGELHSEENITIEGTVDGIIQCMRDVIVAPEGKVRADIHAATVVISGKVRGNVDATNKVELGASGQLEGNIHAPKLSIAESALFKGSIDMSAPDAVKPAEKDKKF